MRKRTAYLVEENRMSGFLSFIEGLKVKRDV